MFTPLVSIIIPIYKVEHYLKQCLDSIVNQTYTNLEIILVDDGSPDNCPQICNEYASHDKRIIIIHKENGGLSDARNAGLAKSSGEYISFVDGDDWVEKNYIETMLQPMSTEDYDFIVADYLRTDEYLESKHLLYAGKIQGTKNILKNFCGFSYPPCACCKLYKTNFIKDHKFQFYKGILFEDQLWSCTLATIAKKIFIQPNRIYHYRIHPNSIMQSNDIAFSQRLFSWSIIFSHMKEILSPHREELAREIDFYFLHKSNEFFAISNNNWEQFKKVFESINNALQTNPILYWSKFTPLPQKFCYLALNRMPLIFSEITMYLLSRKKK